MSLAYTRGFDAGKRARPIACCPYEGHTDPSLALQREWMAGHFDALTQPQPVKRKSHHLTRRRTVRKRWPRSQYARRRVFEALGITRQRAHQIVEAVGDKLFLREQGAQQ